jgi:hypothetical protein
VTFRRAGTFLYGSGPFRAAFTVEPPPTAAAAPAPPAGCPAPTRTTVTVTIEDGRFRFSQTTVPCGIVTFVVTNRGDVDGEDEVDGLVLSVPGGVGRSLAKGQTASLVVALAPGRVDYTAGNYEKNYDGEYGTLVVTR